MPFALVFIGLMLIITGFQNTYAQLGKQVAADFTGEGNFIYWMIAIGIVGAMGYNDTLKPFSRAFMALLIVVIFLSNNGFFTNLNKSIVEGTTTKPLPAGGLLTPVAAAANSGGGEKKSGGGFGSLIKTGLSIASSFL